MSRERLRRPFTSAGAVAARREPAVRIDLCVPADIEAPATARRGVSALGPYADDPLMGDVLLLVSELVTNSVKHSASDWVEVGITLGTDVLRIDVSDQDRQSMRPRTPDADGGWGLTIVGALATRWGVERHAEGKTIWIEFDLS